jgi:hypothetical protein
MLADEPGKRLLVTAPERLDERTFLGRPHLLQSAEILPCSQLVTARRRPVTPSALTRLKRWERMRRRYVPLIEQATLEGFG